MVQIQVKVDLSGLQRASNKFDLALKKTISGALAYGVAQAMKNAPVRTGHLRRSIHVVSQDKTSGVYGTAVVYAAIQEFGGTIRPKRAKYLRFKVGDRWVFARSVTLRGKFYMKRSAEALQQAIPQIARRAVREVGL